MTIKSHNIYLIIAIAMNKFRKAIFTAAKLA